MDKSGKQRIGRREFLLVGAVAVGAAGLSSRADPGRADQARVAIDVSEGWAAETLKAAAGQAKVSFLLSEEVARGVKTRAIKGNFTPLDAFRFMLKGTALEVFRHSQSGVYAVRKVPSKTGERLPKEGKAARIAHDEPG